MQRSENLQLWLPEDTDPLEVSKLSENFETLDPIGSGIEGLKEGAGVGGLFMVSKYYDQPIENAVLCNGGTFDANTYPELSDLLGFKYGGSYSLSNVPSAYNIPSSVKPIGYNAKHDCFIGNINAATVTIYKKNTVPQSIAVTASPKLSGCTCAYGYDDYFVLNGSWSSAYGSSAGTIVFDLTSMTFFNANKAPFPIRHDQGGVGGDRMAIIQNGLIMGGDLVSLKTNPTKYNRVDFGNGPVYSFIYNYDSDNSKVYMLYFYSGTITIAYAPYSGFLSKINSADSGNTVSVSDISTTIGSFATDNDHPKFAIIRNGYFVYIGSTKVTIAPFSNNSFGSKKVVSVTPGCIWSSPPIKLTDSADLYFSTYYQQPTSPTAYTPKHRYFIIDSGNLTEGSASLDVYPAMIDGSERTMICTDAGAKTDAKPYGQKVPNITMSESLVYMRTKGA